MTAAKENDRVYLTIATIVILGRVGEKGASPGIAGRWGCSKRAVAVVGA
ncbi:MAG: hypothetical protein ACK421_08915 [Pseudanabaenaceae cyanobacterium]